MPRSRSSLGVLALLVVLVGTATAGSAWADAHEASSGLRIDAVDTSRYPDVDVTVTAPAALVDRTLGAGDVTVAEGGVVRPAEVERLPGREHDVVLLLDVSGSMGPAMDGVRAATRAFLDRLPRGTQVAVVAFSAAPRLVIGFTDDAPAVQQAVERLRPQGTTALHDAVRYATALLDGRAADARTLVVLADGEDNASSSTGAQAAAAVRGGGVSAFAVALRSGAADRRALQGLVAAVGGRVATAADPARLAAVYAAVGAEVASRYRLRYRSAAHGVTDLEVVVRADGVHQRVGGFPLHLPAAPGWRAAAGEPVGLLAGLLACYAAVAALHVVAFPRRRRVDVARRLAADGATPEAVGLSGPLGRVVERVLRSRGRREALVAALEVAGVNRSPADVVVLVVTATLVAGAVGSLLGGPVAALVAAAAMPWAARALLRRLAQRRRNAFAEQLDDSIGLLASSMRAGLSLVQAVQAVARDGQSPTADEFRRVVNETRLGRDLGDTLQELADRMQSKDFLWLAQAIEIHRDVGGDLTELLDTVGDTIRARGQVRRQIKALTAEGRLSAVILMGLPIVAFGFLTLTNPTYVDEFTASPIGWAMLLTSALLLAVGGLWLRKMIRIEY